MKEDVKGGVHPIGQWDNAAELRYKNVGDEPPDLAAQNGMRIEVDQTQISWIDFVEDEREGAEGRDVTQKSGNGDEAEAAFKFFEKGHRSGTVEEAGRASTTGARCVDTKVAASRLTLHD